MSEGDKNSFTVFVSNDLNIKRLLNSANHDDLKDLNKSTYQMKYDEDLVITGLGFVKIVDKCVIDVYINKDVEVYAEKVLDLTYVKCVSFSLQGKKWVLEYRSGGDDMNKIVDASGVEIMRLSYALVEEWLFKWWYKGG